MTQATARWLRWLGRSLAVLGAAALLVVGGLAAVDLWTEHTTGRANAAAQQRLADELAVASDAPVVGLTEAAAAAGPERAGEPVGTLSFSRRGEQIVAEPAVVVRGVQAEQLAQGPGHYPSTPLPHRAGATGNVAVAGHRTTYGAPFRHLDRLRPGDVATLATPQGTYRYRVVGHRVVAPGDTSVLDPDPLGTGTATLTLTTCDPPGRATERLIVFAEQLG